MYNITMRSVVRIHPMLLRKSRIQLAMVRGLLNHFSCPFFIMYIGLHLHSIDLSICLSFSFYYLLLQVEKSLHAGRLTHLLLAYTSPQHLDFCDQFYMNPYRCTPQRIGMRSGGIHGPRPVGMKTLDVDGRYPDVDTSSIALLSCAY